MNAAVPVVTIINSEIPKGQNQTAIAGTQQQKQGVVPMRSSSQGEADHQSQPSSLTHQSALTLTPFKEPAQPPRVSSALFPVKRFLNSTRGLITFYWITSPRTWVGNSSPTSDTIMASLSLFLVIQATLPHPHHEVFTFLYWECFHFNQAAFQRVCSACLSFSVQCKQLPDPTWQGHSIKQSWVKFRSQDDSAWWGLLDTMDIFT